MSDNRPRVIVSGVNGKATAVHCEPRLGVRASLTEVGNSLRDLAGALFPFRLGDLRALSNRLAHGDCDCKIPPPPWMPIPAGCGETFLCIGADGRLRVVIRNDGYRAQTYKIAIKLLGPAIVTATASPDQLVLGPMEHGTTEIKFHVDSKAELGQSAELLIWIHGCREHYIRWTVHVDARGCGSCHELDVCDAPKLIHDWYDHFYCEYPCGNRQ